MSDWFHNTQVSEPSNKTDSKVQSVVEVGCIVVVVSRLPSPLPAPALSLALALALSWLRALTSVIEHLSTINLLVMTSKLNKTGQNPEITIINGDDGEQRVTFKSDKVSF